MKNKAHTKNHIGADNATKKHMVEKNCKPLSERQISRNREALSDAMCYMKDNKISSMVVYAAVPVCVFVVDDKTIDKETLLVRFTYDRNSPKFAIDELENRGFHQEFSTQFQRIKFQTRNKLLIVKGCSPKFPNGYKVHLHLKSKVVTRAA